MPEPQEPDVRAPMLLDIADALEIDADDVQLVGWADDSVLSTVEDHGRERTWQRFHFDVTPERDAVRDDEVAVILVRIPRDETANVGEVGGQRGG